MAAHVTSPASMTTVDQRVGRDALARYDVLLAEVATVRAELDAILGK